MKYLIFFILIVLICLSLAKRWVFPEKSTKKYLAELKKKGVKRAYFSNYGKWLAAVCFIASFWYIKLGILWLLFGIVILVSALIFLVLPEHHLALPNEGTEEFKKMVQARKK